jgi:hypothetical protein
MCVPDPGEFQERPGSGVPAGRNLQLVRDRSGTLFAPEAATMAVVVISLHQENRLLIYGKNFPSTETSCLLRIFFLYKSIC